MAFKCIRSLRLSQVAESGCNLGAETRELTLFFKVDGVSVRDSGNWAQLHAGMNDGVYQFFAEYAVEIETTSGKNILEQAESQIMQLPAFDGATSVNAVETS